MGSLNLQLIDIHARQRAPKSIVDWPGLGSVNPDAAAKSFFLHVDIFDIAEKEQSGWI
eukprot:SAG11_NODE_33261_length_278_cov_0.860335_1_plen_58_part_00